jgi:uncharacterized phiE125 gp8 family phage protein
MYDLSRRPIPSFVLKTPPVIEPVGLEEVKAHSRIDLDDDDLLIQSKILAVRQMYEQIYNQSVITQTWTMFLDWLPIDCIEIFKRPIQSITSVKWLDAIGTPSTIDPALYWVDLNARPPRIIKTINAVWPYVQPRPSAVAVEFVAGYGDKREDVPENVLCYLLHKVGDFYEHREGYFEAKNRESLQRLDFIDNLISSERLFV